MSNKAEIFTHNLKTYSDLSQLEITTAVTTEEVCKKMPDESMLVTWVNTSGEGGQIIDLPWKYSVVTIKKRNNNYVDCYAARQDGEHAVAVARYRGLVTPSFIGWKILATATQPKKYVLPLSDRFVDGAGGGESRYWINQFGEVGFTISVTASAETVSRTDVGTLPEGFRPASAKIFCASYASDSVRSGGNSVNILANGILRYYGSTIPAGAMLFVSGTFIAGN